MTPTVRAVRLSSGVELPSAELGSADGAPVVFLHAIADSWRSFGRVLPALPASLRSVAPTQRGHGDATKPESGYAVQDFTGDLVELLDLLEIESAVLVVSSSAVFTAQQLAVEWANRVRGLVLIGVPWSLSERAPSLDFVETVMRLEDPVEPVFVREVLEGTSSRRVPGHVLEEMIGESLKVPAHVWQQTLSGLLAAEPPEVGAIRAPTLVIWGERDELIPREDQERLLAAIPGSRLAVYEAAGHVVHWEEPERVARDIAEFVAPLPR